MGMSSSQARLLSLTGRMHDIEYKAQKIQAQKLQLANESDRVYDDYLESLDKQKVMTKILNSDGSLTNTPLTSNLIYTYGNLSDQFVLTTRTGKALMPTSSHNIYIDSNSLSDYLTALGMNGTFTQTVHHSEVNPAYTQAVANYNSDHTAWQNSSNNYNTYQIFQK